VSILLLPYLELPGVSSMPMIPGPRMLSINALPPMLDGSCIKSAGLLGIIGCPLSDDYQNLVLTDSKCEL